MKYNEVIKIIRSTQNMKQKELAKLMGKTQSWLTYVESGERALSVSDLIKLGEVLKFDAWRILKIAESCETFVDLFRYACMEYNEEI